MADIFNLGQLAPILLSLASATLFAISIQILHQGLRHTDSESGSLVQIGATTTDADGTFRFEQQVEGASRIGEGEQLAFYVGVCAGREQGSHNPPAYLPWTDVRFADGETGHCTLVLDRDEVARKLAELQRR